MYPDPMHPTCCTFPRRSGAPAPWAPETAILTGIQLCELGVVHTNSCTRGGEVVAGCKWAQMLFFFLESAFRHCLLESMQLARRPQEQPKTFRVFLLN